MQQQQQRTLTQRLMDIAVPPNNPLSASHVDNRSCEKGVPKRPRATPVYLQHSVVH